MKRRKWAQVTVRIPIDIESGDAGLWYITSPFIKGLLIAEHTEELAEGKLKEAIEDMACASTERSP